MAKRKISDAEFQESEDRCLLDPWTSREVARLVRRAYKRARKKKQGRDDMFETARDLADLMDGLYAYLLARDQKKWLGLDG